MEGLTEQERLRIVGGRDDRDAMRQFGKPYAELDEGEQGEFAVWACKGLGLEAARLHAARDGFLVMARLLALFATVDGERSRSRTDTGFVEAIAAAQAIGTPAALERLADILEPTWHDETLGNARIVSAVEGVEAMRAVARRMRACGMRRLADGLPAFAHEPFPDRTQPRELALFLLDRQYGPLTEAQVGAFSAHIDCGWRFDAGAVLDDPERGGFEGDID